MSDVVDQLHSARELAWPALVPAVDHAIAVALEAEHEARRAATLAQTAVYPAYPPLVELLATAGEAR